MFVVKIHQNSEGQKIMALCDRDLLGQRYEEGNRQLDLTNEFYRGKEATEEEIKELIKDVYIINVVGKKSLQLIEKLKLSPERIITVQKIPHAEIVLIKEEAGNKN